MAMIKVTSKLTPTQRARIARRLRAGNGRAIAKLGRMRYESTLRPDEEADDADAMQVEWLENPHALATSLMVTVGATFAYEPVA